MQRLSSFSHAWMHVVQYRAQSLLPCPFYHKSQSSEASNHKSTDEATIISLFGDSASPSSSSRSHLTALVIVVLVKDFLDENKAVVSACRRHLRTTYRGLPQWCSPSNALRQTTNKRYHRRHRNGEGIQIQLLPPFFCTQGQYIKITICKGPLTLIEAKLMRLATKDINIPCMNVEVRRFVCIALH